MDWIFGKIDADLAHRPIHEISTPEIVAVLKREEEAGNLETARRMRTVSLVIQAFRSTENLYCTWFKQRWQTVSEASSSRQSGLVDICASLPKAGTIDAMQEGTRA
jgi:hypothetical protein